MEAKGLNTLEFGKRYLPLFDLEFYGVPADQHALSVEDFATVVVSPWHRNVLPDLVPAQEHESSRRRTEIFYMPPVVVVEEATVLA